MSEPMHIGLDNPAFNGRLRTKNGRPFNRSYQQRPSKKYFDQQISRKSASKPDTAVNAPDPVWSRPLSKPPTSYQAEPAASAVALAGEAPVSWLEPQPFDSNDGNARSSIRNVVSALTDKYSKLQIALALMSVMVFAFGVAVSFQSALTNHKNAAKVAALSKQAEGQGNGSGVPSTNKPSSSAVRNYTVAPDLPRYIKIPKLGVNARVMQVGVKSDGSLGTPSNVYDAAWYTGSSKPGQPGAMLIDGHVSSWTTHGVFYGLKRLTAGDIITIQRGDGQIFTYKVVKSQTYSDNNVDMQAAVRPITPGKPGLNLITCTGRVKPGTSEFNQRIIVFAEQI